MEAFASGEVDVLVATTVIEVGIDVPNASVMVIEGAERYGISHAGSRGIGSPQLHLPHRRHQLAES